MIEIPLPDSTGIRSHAVSFKSGGDTSVGTIPERINPPTEEEMEQVSHLLEDEKSHLKQWRKHLLAIVIITVSLIVNFLRGSRKTPSIIGISKCGTLDWSIFFSFIAIAFLMSYIGVLINIRE